MRSYCCNRLYAYLIAGTLTIHLSSSFALAGDESTDLIQRAKQVGYAVKSVSINNGIASQFFPKDFTYKRGLHNTVGDVVFDQLSFKYRLHVPEKIETGQKYPLIVWLHGCGDERGWDNKSQLQYMEKTFFRPEVSELAQFYILVPQCPLVPGEWFKHSANSRGNVVNGGNDMLAVVNEIIDKTIAENPIDADRVTVVGISCSASACVELAIRQPDKFAALAPLSLGYIPSEQLPILPKCPIWIFNNTSDEYMNDVSFQELGDLIVKANNGDCNIAHTVIKEPEWKHDSWSIAFQKYDLLNWLLKQYRGKHSWYYPPGVKPADWPWRQPLRDWTAVQLLTEASLIVAFLAFVGYVCYRIEIFETRGQGIPRVHREQSGNG